MKKTNKEVRITTSRIAHRENALIEACRNKNVARVEEIIKKEGVRINLRVRTKNGELPIHIACMNGCIEIVKKLLERARELEDFDYVNERATRGGTALHIACTVGNRRLVTLLLFYGASINRTDNKYDSTSLWTACISGATDIVTLLLRQKKVCVDVNKAAYNGDTALHRACIDGTAEMVKELLLHPDIKVNIANSEKFTALHLACIKGDLKKVEYLLKHPDIDINANGKKDETPLQIACGKGIVDMVRLILSHKGVNINSGGKEGITALHITSNSGRIDIIDEILAYKGVDVNIANHSGVTPLYIACGGGNKKVVERLLKCEDIDVNKSDKCGTTPLHMACSSNSVGVVTELFKRSDLKLNIMDQEGYTPLHVACGNGKAEIVKLFLSYEHDKINVNFAQRNGITALHMACLGFDEVVDILLNCPDINVNAVMENGITPILGACKIGSKSIVEKLLARDDIDITITPFKNSSLIREVRGRYRTEILDMLQERALKDLSKVCSSGDIDKTRKLLELVRNIEPMQIKELINVSTPEVLRYLIKRFGTTKVIEATDASNLVMDYVIKESNVLFKVSGKNKDILEKRIAHELKLACKLADENNVGRLLSTGIDISKDESYIKIALSIGNPNIIHMLRNRGALEIRNEEYVEKKVSEEIESELLYVIKNGEAKYVRKLLNNGANANEIGEEGKSALMYAAARGDKGIVVALLEKGADVNARDNKQKSALIYAIEEDNALVAKKLIENGADVNICDENNRSVLMYALRRGESMSFIINYKLGITPVDKCDKLGIASTDEEGKLKISSVNEVDMLGISLLMHACQGEYEPAIKRLVEKGANVNNISNKGYTAVGIVFNKGNMKLTKYFIKRGATCPGNVDKKNEFYKLLDWTLNKTSISKPVKLKSKNVLEKKPLKEKM
ncbi:MAG: ankyrin repeat domain-containing protein [Clostridiales bacterium]|nr:ankyrin repeat domain-containing protein [Clostridiales bacterium]